MNLTISKEASKAAVMPTFKKSSYSFFEAVILIVVGALFFLYMVRPKKAEVALQKEQLQKLTSEQKSLKDNVDTLQSLISEMKSRSADVRHLDETLPLSGGTISLQLLIEKLAADSGVVLGETSFNDRSDRISAGNKTLLSDPYGVERKTQKITSRVYVVGKFTQIEAFMKKLENSGRLINVSDFEISGFKRDQLDATLTIEAYYYE